MRAALLAPALAAADEPLPFPLLRQYARYWRDGVRTDYENDVRRLGIMTGEAVLAAVATGQQRWVDRADRKSTRLKLQSRGHLVCRLLLEKINSPKQTSQSQSY